MHATALPALSPKQNNRTLQTLTQYSQVFHAAPIPKKQGKGLLTLSMAVLASSPIFLAPLAFLFVLVCSLISPTKCAELVPDRWHEFEVPVVPEDKVMFKIQKRIKQSDKMGSVRQGWRFEWPRKNMIEHAVQWAGKRECAW